MKKLFLLLFLSLGFIGSTYAASRAGIAFTYGFGSVAISAGLGFVLFILIKPKKDTEEKKAVYYGRLFLAYIIWIGTAAIFPKFLINPNTNTFMTWLGVMIAYGFIAYVIGSGYGAFKKTDGTPEANRKERVDKVQAKEIIDEFNSDTYVKDGVVRWIKSDNVVPQDWLIDFKESMKAPIQNSTINKTVEKPEKITPEKNMPKNEDIINKEIFDDIDDEEFYLTATKEVEGENINAALWAKCMAINTGDENKSKYDYINRRVEGLKAEQAEAKKIVEEKEAKRIAGEKGAKRKAERAAKTLERIVAENKELNLSNKAQEMYWEYDGIKFNSKESMEAYIQIKLSGRS